MKFWGSAGGLAPPTGRFRTNAFTSCHTPYAPASAGVHMRVLKIAGTVTL